MCDTGIDLMNEDELTLHARATAEHVEETIRVDGSLLQPVGEQLDSVLDDSEVSELSARFVDSLGLPLKQETPAAALESKVADPLIDDATKQKFNEGMEVISRFAEDVVKTWFAQMYKHRGVEDSVFSGDLKELFPDGLIGHTGSIKMMPGPEALEARRLAKRVSVNKDEESRGDDAVSDALRASLVDTSGWELKLCVVDANHRELLARWRDEEPAVLQQMQGLLKMAWGYIQYALEAYDLPTPELFREKVIPSPWGTLYVLGAPDDAVQIGVSITQCVEVNGKTIPVADGSSGGQRYTT
jgi:copper chaperone CopZ